MIVVLSQIIVRGRRVARENFDYFSVRIQSSKSSTPPFFSLIILKI